MAADYVGPQVMLEVLGEIQEFHITQLEGDRTSDKPSLAQRLAKLKQYWTETNRLT